MIVWITWISTLGEYQDRRNLQKIDCSKTIWILATNALDDKIRNFCQVNGSMIWDEEDENKQTRLIKTLTKELKEDFLKIFQVGNRPLFLLSTTSMS